LNRKTLLVLLIIISAVSLRGHWGIAQEDDSSLPEPVATEGRILPLEEFIDLSVKKDTVFEEILIDELTLKYQKDLNLPARDLVLSVKTQYDFILDQNREETGGSVSLEKLFPYTGTEINAGYTVTPSLTSSDSASSFTFEFTQPIAENAFGKVTRLKDTIIGLENEVARHQIVEAYEDYLAATLTSYCNWYEAYENLKIGESSYRENMKLLDNIKERQRNSIALPIDVNKITLQVLDKKEKLIELKEEYESALSEITKSIRYQGSEALIPQRPSLYDDTPIAFEKDFALFRRSSRTWKILRLLDEKTHFEVEQNANELFPSIDLFVGYNVKGENFGITSENSKAYAGVSIEWPFPDQVQRAEYEISKVERDKARLKVGNTYYQYALIESLALQIEREKKLKSISDEKISLAAAVLADETENYSFGKITLNDYIQAVNALDSSRFSEILHASLQKKLMIEWLRITDRLISKKKIKTSYK